MSCLGRLLQHCRDRFIVYFHPGKRLGELCSCEPLLYAATEHREVGVPLNVLHPRVNAGGHVPTSIQRLQPERVVPVELPEGEKKGISLTEGSWLIQLATGFDKGSGK